MAKNYYVIYKTTREEEHDVYSYEKEVMGLFGDYDEAGQAMALLEEFYNEHTGHETFRTTHSFEVSAVEIGKITLDMADLVRL